MALIICPECGNSISDKADSCPHCGLPSSYFPKPDAAAAGDPEAMDWSALALVMPRFQAECDELMNCQRYLSRREWEQLKERYGQYADGLCGGEAIRLARESGEQPPYVLESAERFLARMDSLKKEADVHNEAFVTRTLEEERDYFDHILDAIDPEIKLDEEQRRAVVTDEDHCLLVAGAGAGKTTTMAAKVRYLVERQGVNPEEIIVISYTNKAIGELRERINDTLGIPARICTFHSFAFDLVKRFSSRPPEVNFAAKQIISDILQKLIFHNQPLLRNLVLFLGCYFEVGEDLFDFKDLEEYHAYQASQDYETLKSRLGEYIDKMVQKRSKRTRTITGEYLRSSQEVQIANFLYLNGLDYEYERVYPYGSPSKWKLYTPDFCITQGDRTAWLEHYALAEDGYSNLLTAKERQRYFKSIWDKRKLHRDCNTALLETWSQYKDRRPLLEHLKETLEEAGFVLAPRDQKEVYEKLAETGKDKYIDKLVVFMTKFIEQYKTAGYDASGFDQLRGRTDNPRTLLFLDVAQQVYDLYQAELKRRGEIDFADMINDAHVYLKEMDREHLQLPYKYIIIDEFQDIARQRFNLTQSLSEVTRAKVVAVGDDWQSIYAFSGSDITLFTRFLELMGGGKELKITHTYRNSQELIDIAGSFVQKNAAQIRKQLVSPKRLKDPVIVEAYDDSSKPAQALARTVEKLVGEIVEEFGTDGTILLVGRYGFDASNLCRTGLFREHPKGHIHSAAWPDAKIFFLTAHSSKGLGYDNVILLNMSEGKFGFPCQIEDDPIMRLVTTEDRTLPFAEERRLFYVALTRTKNRVYIAAPKSKPSRFLLELVRDCGVSCRGELSGQPAVNSHLRCPACGYPLKYELNKNYGLNLWICTNEPEVCDFMTNNKEHMHDIYKCPRCGDGYMVVRVNKDTGSVFYGCTNFFNPEHKCGNMVPLDDREE